MPDTPQNSMTVEEIQQAYTRFQVARSEYIDSYAHLEMAMADLLAHAMPCDPSLANAVLFSVSNASTRNNILESALQHSRWSGTEPFYKSLLEKTSKATSFRNKVVHYIVVRFWTKEGVTFALSTQKEKQQSETRSKMDIKSFRKNGPEHYGFIETKTMIAQKLLLLFLSELFQSYENYIAGNEVVNKHQQKRDAWHDIFRSKIQYPPPLNHPLGPTHQERAFQHRS